MTTRAETVAAMEFPEKSKIAHYKNLLVLMLLRTFFDISCLACSVYSMHIEIDIRNHTQVGCRARTRTHTHTETNNVAIIRCMGLKCPMPNCMLRAVNGIICCIYWNLCKNYIRQILFENISRCSVYWLKSQN